MIVLTVTFVEILSACPPDKVIYKRAPDKGLWWFWHSEVWPRCEVEVSYGAHLPQSFHNSIIVWIQLKWEELLMIYDQAFSNPSLRWYSWNAFWVPFSKYASNSYKTTISAQLCLELQVILKLQCLRTSIVSRNIHRQSRLRKITCSIWRNR